MTLSTCPSVDEFRTGDANRGRRMDQGPGAIEARSVLTQ